MEQKISMRPIAFALGTAFVTTLSGPGVSSAADNPFAMSEITGGYLVADAAEGKCGGEMKSATEGKCGEGKCGAEKKSAAEGKCGGEKKSGAEGKCGEGKCGGEKKSPTEGKCGGSK